jgi:hypothetical protein
MVIVVLSIPLLVLEQTYDGSSSSEMENTNDFGVVLQVDLCHSVLRGAAPLVLFFSYVDFIFFFPLDTHLEFHQIWIFFPHESRRPLTVICFTE